VKVIVALLIINFSFFIPLISSPLDTIPAGINFDLRGDWKDWKEFNSYDGKFSVLTLGEMKEKVDSIETAVGTLAYHVFFYKPQAANADNVLYMLSYVDYPEGTIHSDSTQLLQDFFKETLDAAVSSVKGELLYSNDWKYHNYSGKIWRIDYLNGKAIIKTKACVVGQRYYTLQTVTRKEKSLNFAADRFLDSFKLIE
jgi:hypothetical protein